MRKMVATFYWPLHHSRFRPEWRQGIHFAHTQQFSSNAKRTLFRGSREAICFLTVLTTRLSEGKTPACMQPSPTRCGVMAVARSRVDWKAVRPEREEGRKECSVANGTRPQLKRVFKWKRGLRTSRCTPRSSIIRHVHPFHFCKEV